jgi:RNase H-fold protein (predicted Holliday junction resolvase)
MKVEDLEIEFWWQRIGCVRNPGAHSGEEVARDNEIHELRKALQSALNMAQLSDDERSTITEAAQALTSAAKHNKAQCRTVLAYVQQDRADRLNAIINEKESA